MKIGTTVLFIALAVNSVWTYPTGGHPDDDAEVVVVPLEHRDGFHHNVPAVPSVPPVPSVPSIPSVPRPTLPEIPTVPTYPAYYPTPGFGVVDANGYDINQPGVLQYVPINPYGWNYNIFDGFSGYLRRFRDQAAQTWSQFPSFRPTFNFWPEVQQNGKTTSTVKVVGNHKITINDTIYVQKTNYGNTVYKVRKVDIQPIGNDETTVSGDDGTTVSVPDSEREDDAGTTLEPQPEPEVIIDNENREEIENTDNQRNNDNADGGESVTTTREIEYEEPAPNADENVDIDNNNDNNNAQNGSPEQLDNEISKDAFENIETFETTESIEEFGELKKEPLPALHKFDPFSYFPKYKYETHESTPNERLDDEIDENNTADAGHENDIQREAEIVYDDDNTNDNNNNENIPVDLSNDIAINQMLADQGAPYNPDAEIFDIHQFNLNEHERREHQRQRSQPHSHEINAHEKQQQNFDYLPYHHHQSNDNGHSIIK